MLPNLIFSCESVSCQSDSSSAGRPLEGDRNSCPQHNKSDYGFRKSIGLGDIFHRGEVDPGLCGLLWCAVTDGLSGEGGLNKLDSSEGFGAARKRHRFLRWKGDCLHICLSAALAVAAKFKDRLFPGAHGGAKGF